MRIADENLTLANDIARLADGDADELGHSITLLCGAVQALRSVIESRGKVSPYE
jgi:hypothetical protein